MKSQYTTHEKRETGLENINLFIASLIYEVRRTVTLHVVRTAIDWPWMNNRKWRIGVIKAASTNKVLQEKALINSVSFSLATSTKPIIFTLTLRGENIINTLELTDALPDAKF